MEDLETPTTTTTATDAVALSDLHNPDNGETATTHEPDTFYEDFDSTCSTPYVSAPSSPGRGPPASGFYYSAPASPMHFMLSTSNTSTSMCSKTEGTTVMSSSFEFDFSARLATNGLASGGSMSSADELFLNGQIRPMKLSTHLQRPQILAPLLDLDETNGLNCEDFENNDEEKVGRGRDLKLRDRSIRRRTRSMSPLRSSSFHWHEDDDSEDREGKSTEVGTETKDVEGKQSETMPSRSSSSSRSSSRRWVFLKEFLYRSKSEGRNNTHKFWSSLSFSPAKEKKSDKISSPTAPSNPPASTTAAMEKKKEKQGIKEAKKKRSTNGKVANGVGKRRMGGPSAHELHYTSNRAQAEEMRKKTFLPYRQGVLGCLGFSSKSYGAMNGIARALNPVSSR
ncbi:unnamed protein product [Ilex paraguariensis]|uniref:Calmodulin-binding protein n=1 Tax=Ilex paraguariensis TaxID=185542 RepID=A0ABC8V476_9AQUA